MFCSVKTCGVPMHPYVCALIVEVVVCNLIITLYGLDNACSWGSQSLMSIALKSTVILHM